MTDKDLLKQAQAAAPFLIWSIKTAERDMAEFVCCVGAETRAGMAIGLALLKSGRFSASVIRPIAIGRDAFWMGKQSATVADAINTALRSFYYDPPSQAQYLDVGKGGAA